MALNLEHPLAFVPTMGALHAGHQSLIKLAKSKSANVAVSIFVNPLQFENQDDLIPLETVMNNLFGLSLKNAY